MINIWTAVAFKCCHSVFFFWGFLNAFIADKHLKYL